MQNAAPLYCTIKKIQRFEDRVIWRVYGRFSRTITRDYAVFFSRVGTLCDSYVYRHLKSHNLVMCDSNVFLILIIIQTEQLACVVFTSGQIVTHCTKLCVIYK